jgi:3-hydroxybutyryl-CoA dehydrogenase
MAREIRKVGVVGLGTMGAGIAQVCVEAGFDTVGREVEAGLGEKARERIEHFLGRKVEKGQLEAQAKDDALEAAFEELGVKHEVFRELELAVADDVILASNTSALSVTQIASVLERPERVVGMHFFNPAPLMSLVEIVRAERTAEDVFEAAYDFARRLGKEPIRCNDTPGFVVNRILIPLLNDCVRVLDEAGVSVEDLDKALRHGAGWPMGPATLVDLVGVDIHVHASEALYEKLREPRMAPPPRLVRMAQAGKLGQKSGEGFYTYNRD